MLNRQDYEFHFGKDTDKVIELVSYCIGAGLGDPTSSILNCMKSPFDDEYTMSLLDIKHDDPVSNDNN